jgi:energy-coupling factor transporter ATP-binding protein EcfA2
MASTPPEKPPQKEDAPNWADQLKKKAEELALSLGIPGGLVSWSVHLATKGEWKQAAIAFVGAGIFALLIKLYTPFAPKLDELFAWIAINIMDWFLTTCWKIGAGFQRDYYESLTVKCRAVRTNGLKTDSPFPLNLEKVFVPLKVALESASKISSAMIQKKESRKEAPQNSQEIWDFLAKDSKQLSYTYIVIMGSPGSGKTTLLQHLTLVYVKKAQRQHNPKLPSLIPILLYLREIRSIISNENPPNLAELIAQQSIIAKNHSQKYSQKWFSDKLRQGKCLVMLDGLDEVADEKQRRAVSQWVNDQIVSYRRNIFLLTSRPFGYYSTVQGEIKTVLEIQEFNQKQTRQFIQNWYLQYEIENKSKSHKISQNIAKKKADNLISQIENTGTLSDMAVNPLLLTMIAQVHQIRGELPRHRINLYKEIYEVFLGQWQEAKAIRDRLTAYQKQSVLQELALALMKQPTREFTLKQGCDLIRRKLHMVAKMTGESMRPDEFLSEVKNTGLLVEPKEGSYEFGHKTFQEYLAAVEIKETEQETLLIQNIGDVWWEETTRLFAAQSDPSQIIKAALKLSTVSALALAVDCLEEGRKIDSQIKESLERCISSGLESTDPKFFKLSVEVMLTRRFRKLIRIDDSIEIDQTPITCAEYQLFIDDEQQKGIKRQPDHWETSRFIPGDAVKPITGIRANDAEAFCLWLSKQKYGQYRLPKESELKNYPFEDRRVGHWCMYFDKKKIEGISEEKRQEWKRQLLERLTQDRDIAQSLVRDLKVKNGFTPQNPSLNLDLDLDLALTHFRNFNSDLAHAHEDVLTCIQDLASVRAQAQKTEKARVYISDQDLLQSYERDLDTARIRAKVTESQQRLINMSEMSELTVDQARLYQLEQEHLMAKSDSERRRIENEYRRIQKSFGVDQPDISIDTFDISTHLNHIENLEHKIRTLKHKIKNGSNPERVITLDSQVRDRESNLDRALSIAQALTPSASMLELLHARTSDLDDSLYSIDKDLQSIRKYLLAIAASWHLMLEAYEKTRQEQDTLSHKSFSRQKRELYKQRYKLHKNQYEQSRTLVIDLYLFFLLLDSRKTGHMPSWEGIRVVKDNS